MQPFPLDPVLAQLIAKHQSVRTQHVVPRRYTMYSYPGLGEQRKVGVDGRDGGVRGVRVVSDPCFGRGFDDVGGEDGVEGAQGLDVGV